MDTLLAAAPWNAFPNLLPLPNDVATLRAFLNHRAPALTPGEDVIFEFHPGRGQEFAGSLVGSFEGFMQRDGYGVVWGLTREKPGLIPVGC